MTDQLYPVRPAQQTQPGRSSTPTVQERPKTAVMYLRVSTVGQVRTDYDPEGISIPAQREACQRKAEQLGLTIIDEYVEPGRTATSMAKRPVFQQMLERLRLYRDVDVVIVYNLSRLNRNRVDDVTVMVALQEFGVSLVSTQENIDATPSGQLLHGILAAINEYRSRSDGEDIRYKMGQKVKNGGSVGRAKLGYLNVRDTTEGREIRTVVVDEERAPLVRHAFELYASGNYTLATLAERLTQLGLRTRGAGHRWPAGPISLKRLNVVLRDPYYTGVTVYQSVEYPGRHEALISRELFDRVQLVLNLHQTAYERDRRNSHYLKGLLWCGLCHERGRESRLVIQRSRGNGGEYVYYFCASRRKYGCDLRHLPVEDVENAVVSLYRRVQIPRGLENQLQPLLEQAFVAQRDTVEALSMQRDAALRRLDAAEQKILDLAGDADIDVDVIRSRLAHITQERRALELAETLLPSPREAHGSLRELTAGLRDLRRFYAQAGPTRRRMINQAFLERVYVYATSRTPA